MGLLEDTISLIELQNQEIREEAVKHIHNLTMPSWALGRVLDLAVDLAGITGEILPNLTRKMVVLMAGDHGIVEEGVCPQKSDITTQMIYNFINGGAGINALAKVGGIQVKVVDMGMIDDVRDLKDSGKVLDYKVACGTKNFANGPAMSRSEAIQALENGIKIAQKFANEVDVFGTGEMGIGNTSPSSAIVSVLSNSDNVLPFVGRGAGLAVEKLAHKAEVIQRGINLNQPNKNDGIDVLSKVGGFEIGGIAGLILGAASLKKVVVVDGFISSAGALIAAAIEPKCRDYMVLAHGSVEAGHKKMAEILGKKPLLDLEMRLGEGTGAAIAMHLIDCANSVMKNMATWDSAHVDDTGVNR